MFRTGTAAGTGRERQLRRSAPTLVVAAAGNEGCACGRHVRAGCWRHGFLFVLESYKHLGRDQETNKLKYHNRTIYGPMREAQAYLTRRLRERDLGRDVRGITAEIT